MRRSWACGQWGTFVRASGGWGVGGWGGDGAGFCHGLVPPGLHSPAVPDHGHCSTRCVTSVAAERQPRKGTTPCEGATATLSVCSKAGSQGREESALQGRGQGAGRAQRCAWRRQIGFTAGRGTALAAAQPAPHRGKSAVLGPQARRPRQHTGNRCRQRRQAAQRAGGG